MAQGIKFENLQDFLQKSDFLFQSLIALPLLPFIAAFIFIKDDPTVAYLNTEPIIPALLAIIAAIPFGLSFFLYHKKILEARQQPTLRGKMNGFWQAAKRNYISMCIASLLLAGAMFLSGQKEYAGLYVLCLIIISTQRPTIYRLNRTLKLNEAERRTLRNNEQIEG